MPKKSLLPLQHNIHLLGEILGDTISACEGRDFFLKVESLRRLAKRARKDKSAQAHMEREMNALTGAEKYKVAKAFTEFLQMANVAEQTHRIRRRRYYRAAGRAPQKASPVDMFARLLKAGVPVPKIKQALVDIQIELVMTAHPTEVMLPGTIRTYRDLSANLLALDNPALPPSERAQIVNAIRAIVLRQWLTRQMRDDRPSPQEEAKYGLELTEKILWTAVPQFFRQLRGAFNQTIGSMVDLFPCPIRFASWIGGDRDGHPGVTAAVTRDVLDMSMTAARRLYHRELEILRLKLIFDHDAPAGVKVNAYCAKSIADLRAKLDGGMSRADFMRGLETLKAFLQKNNLWTLVEKEFQDLIWRVRTFGLSLLKLDLRQSAEVHKNAVAAFIKGYADMPEDKKIAALLRALKGRVKKPPRLSAENREVLKTLELLRDYPAESFGPYIISMAAEASDLLAVQFLMKAAGVTEYYAICPLFETPDSLAGAARVMERVYGIPAYRRYIRDHQEIMLGYSDSGKRGGYIKSAWEIYNLQQDLMAVGRKRGISTTFFHGRGGAIARGGGPIEMSLLALPRPLASRSIRVTEQGEVINAKFGLPEVAGRTMEIYTSGFMEAVLSPPVKYPAAWQKVMDRLSAVTAADFRKAIYESPDFMDHYEQLTPARELSLLKIGSRPGSRKKGGGLESMRAIPWVFSWTQSRTILPVWKGVAAGIEKEIADGNLKTLQEMYRKWPFFRSIIDLIEMAVSKADIGVTQYYSNLLVDKRLQPVTAIYMKELAHVRKLLVRVSGHGRMLENNPVLKRSIEIRSPYVDILNILQAHLLKEYRAARHPSRDLMRTLALTFSGVSAGMRNTG